MFFKNLFKIIGNQPFIKNTYQFCKDLLLNTRVEIVIGLFAATTFAAVNSYRHEKKQKAHKPVAFSEMEYQVNKARAEGRELSVINWVYGSVNDSYMKYAEGSNDALRVDEDHRRYALELERHENKAKSSHMTIGEYAEMMPKITQDFMTTFAKPDGAANDAAAIIQAFDAAWTESHVDHYHPEVYYVTVYTGTGKNRSSHREPRIRQVYDNTTHSYYYHEDAGNRAAQLMEAFMQKYPDMNIGAKLEKTDEVHEDNKNAILRSMEERFKKKKPSKQEFLDLANTFATASNFAKYFPAVKQNYNRLTKVGMAWQSAKGDAHSDSYKTRSRSDRGPEEYRMTKNAMEYAKDMHDADKVIVDGVLFAAKKIPELDSLIKEYVDVVLYGKKGDADKLRDQIEDLAPQIYEKNFKDGFDVYPFKWVTVILLTALGAAAGAGVGALADKGIDALAEKRRRRRNEKESQKISF